MRKGRDEDEEEEVVVGLSVVVVEGVGVAVVKLEERGENVAVGGADDAEVPKTESKIGERC